MYSFICNNFFHCDGEVLYVDLRPKILLLFFFQLKDVKDIVIAKMDATANDSPPQYQVQG